MKIKLLSLAVLTSLGLIGCGGGSNNDDPKNSNNNQDSNTSVDSNPSSTLQQWETFRLDELKDNNDQIENYKKLNAQFNIINGKLYAIFDESDEYQDMNEFYLTQNGQYRGYGPTHNLYGKEVGDIVVTSTQFKIQPYSDIGSKGLEFLQTHKQLDISDKSVLAALDPMLSWNLKYSEWSPKLPELVNNKLKSYQALNFPKGSTCLQISEHANNQEYLTLLDQADQSSFEQYAEEFSDRLNKNYFKYSNFNTAIAYHYSYDADERSANSGITEYKGMYYHSEIEHAGVEYNLAQDMQEQKNYIAQSSYSTDEKAAMNELITGFNNSCDFYNNVAIKYLKDNIKF